MRHGGGPFGKKVYSAGGSHPAAPASEPGRVSRYDPSSPSRPVSGRSRYNPEYEGEGEESGSKSRYSGSRYNSGVGRQPRPRSVDMDTAYQSGQMNGIGLNSASGYYSRSNKWRSHSGSKLDYESYAGNGPRTPFWKANRGKYVVPAAAPAPGSRMNRYNNYSPPSVLAQSRSSSEESENPARSPNSNPNSLGSSLINSVTQTNRDVERQHAADHKRIHPEKPVPLRPPQEQPKVVDKIPVQQKDISPAKNAPNTTWEVFEKDKEDKEDKEDKVDQDEDEDEDENEEEEEEEEEEESTKEDIREPIFQSDQSWVYDDYEFIYDPKLSKTNILNLSSYEPINHYTVPIQPIDKCIFPLTRAETRLWELKNQSRDKIVKNQKYLLRKPIKSLQTYPFIQQNILIHRQAVRPLLCRQIAALRKFERGKKLQLQKQFSELQSAWEAKCHKMDELSDELRREELELKKKEELEEQERERQDKEASQQSARFSGSRRRNRADFVDDTEIENVLLQIDPDYKHHQQAAEIPPMIIHPVKRFAFRFKDVNNLVTDKNAWAARILKDGIDTFTQDEHELFVEGYLSYPKKFGKISQFMGGLRSPEDCVLHYYKTKSSVDYKKLLNDRNKKRQKGAIAKRRKKKERSSEVENGPSTLVSEPEYKSGIQEHIETHSEKVSTSEDQFDEKPQLQMQQVEIKLPAEEKDNKLPVAETPDDSCAAEVVTQNLTQEDKAVAQSQPEEPGTSNIKIATFAQKRTYEGFEGPTDVEKNMAEENRPTLPAISPGFVPHPESTDLQAIDRMNPDIFQSNAMNDEQVHRKRQKSNGDHKSSYWSVKEANLFPELLKQFGSQWSLISEKLGTKSTTMVRNYYQRNAAQLGWKSVVEEADFKRNATSSGSVQQSQILIQAEQNSMPIINGIPPQQKPALGFFSNQVSAERRVPYEIATPPKPFIPDLNKDSFSQASTPNSTLPPPRLPSIHLPGTTAPENLKSEAVTTHPPVPSAPSVDDMLPKTTKPVGGGSSSLNSILNSHDKRDPFSPTNSQPQASQFTHIQSAVRPSIGTMMAQDVQTSSSSSPGERRSSSISQLLNPESQKPLQPITTSSSNAPVSDATAPIFYPSVAQPPPRESFNFAMDPLGALAAIASESLQSSKNAQIGNSQGNNS